ncbi:MAG: nitroreductase family protein [Frankiales bacterium]|nr:nitroreductase family protein [Frankiales bacterium]
MTLHPLLSTRWSPRGFDPAQTLSRAQLLPLVEAARWAPSSGNTQSTRWALVPRDDPRHERLLQALNPGNRTWAGRAAALLVVVGLTEDEAGKPYRTWQHDAGQAVAHLSLQAVAEGLHTHQMAGYDKAAVRELLGLTDVQQPVVVVAVGALGGPPLPDALAAREAGERVRRPVEELVL